MQHLWHPLAPLGIETVRVFPIPFPLAQPIPIWSAPVAALPTPMSLYHALSLQHLHNNFAWTKGTIQTNDAWDTLRSAAARSAKVSNQRWQSSGILNTFRGISLVNYLDHLDACNYECEICKDPVYPVKATDNEDGTVEQHTVGNIDHTKIEENGEVKFYVRGILCRECNTNLGRLGDMCQKILNTSYKYISYVNNAEQTFRNKSPDPVFNLRGKECIYCDHRCGPGYNNYNSLRESNKKFRRHA